MAYTGIESIKAKLQAYRRRFYLNQMLRGGLLLVLLLASLFLLFTLSEGLLWLSVTWRSVLFYSLVLSGLGVTGYFVAYPLLKYLNVAPALSDAEAARLIGKHFPEVDDKLLNMLELSASSEQDNALIAATLEQRSQELRPIPFYTAVSFRPNWRLARYAVIPLLLLLFLFAINPEFVSQGASRLVNYNKHYTPPPPYRVMIEGHKAQLIDGSSHTIDVTLKGDVIPSEVFIYIKKDQDLDYQKYMLKQDQAAKANATRYQYTFENVHQDFSYYIGNKAHGSRQRTVEVLKRPAVGSFFVTLDYPAYTGKDDDTLTRNVGDFSALYGTRATWHFSFKGPVQSAEFRGKRTMPIELATESGATTTFSHRIKQDEQYYIALASGRSISNEDTVRYNIKAMPDKRPGVTVRQPGYETQLPNSGIVPLEADLSDDYGFSQARFFYRFTQSDNPGKTSEAFESFPLEISAQGSMANLFRRIDFIDLGAEQGDELEFFVKVWDNDVLRGPKSAKSVVHKVVYHSLKKQYQELNKQSESISSGLSGASKEAKEVTEQYDKMQKKLLDKKNLSYEDRKQMEELLKEQKNLQQKMQQMSQQMNQQIEQSRDNNLLTEETLQKMDKLKQLMEQISDEQLQKKLQEMQKQLQNMNRQEMQHQMEDMKERSEDFQENIERAMELFKQMKADQKVQELVKKLQNMKQRQEMLQEKTQEAGQKPEDQKQKQLDELAEKQQELRREMQDIKQEMEKLEQMKQETRTPDKEEMQQLKEQAEDTKQQMNDASQKMQQGKPNQAGQKQQRSKDQMQKMREQLSQMQMSSDMQQATENYEDLRALLENILTLSFDQEELRDKMKNLHYNDPALKKYTRKQDKIHSDFQMVEDSLKALAQRSIQVQKFVTDEVDAINRSMDRTMEKLDQRRVNLANAEQHKTMTSMNKLANMLVESLQNMQKQIRQMKGMGMMCKQPKPGSQSMSELSEQQKRLNEQLRQMMKQGKQGKQGKKGKQGMKKLQEMAQEQAQIREQLKKAYERIRKEGQKGLGDLGKVGEDMKESEEELKNKQLTQQLMERQKRILNRMLDYNKSMRQREFSKKRKGETGEDKNQTPPAQLDQEELKQRIRREQFSRSKFQYTPTYRRLIEEYYQLLDNPQ